MHFITEYCTQAFCCLLCMCIQSSFTGAGRSARPLDIVLAPVHFRQSFMKAQVYIPTTAVLSEMHIALHKAWHTFTINWEMGLVKSLRNRLIQF